jgi:hypothetical protein
VAIIPYTTVPITTNTEMNVGVMNPEKLVNGNPTPGRATTNSGFD